MANKINQGFMVLDTASSTPYTKNQYMVTGVRWVSDAAGGGDECELADQNGNIFFESSAGGANWNDGQTINMGGILVNGITVLTLAGGTATVYFK